ncbi:MAG: hypothetical protein ACD_75C01073G0001, partial [uncultured bacterium]
RAVALFPDMGGKFRLHVPGLFRQHEAVQTAQEEMERDRGDSQFHSSLGKLSVSFLGIGKKQGKALVLSFGKLAQKHIHVFAETGESLSDGLGDGPPGTAPGILGAKERVLPVERDALCKALRIYR